MNGAPETRHEAARAALRSAPLRDAHVHIEAHGEELSCVNLADCPSLDECLRRLARAASEAAPGAWVKAVACRIEAWPERRYPLAREIDAATEGRPAIVMSFDHHALAASSAALRAAGIDHATPDPQGGIIERQDGKPTGLVLEEAAWMVRRAAPPPTEADVLERVRAGLADFARRGIVEVHDMLATPGLVRALAKLESRGELALAVWLYATREHFEAVEAACAALARGSRVRLAGLKIFTDGTLNSRTAHMLTDYRDPIPGSPRGSALMSAEQIDDALRFADARGLPIAAHAIGDAAVRDVLDAVERVRPEAAGQRIEHAQCVDERDVPRFASMGVIASVQPCHLLTDVEAVERFMPHRAGRAFPLRELIDSAARSGRSPTSLVWLGSDAPIVPPEPMDNVQAAVHRRRATDGLDRTIAPAQAISLEEVVMCSRAS